MKTAHVSLYLNMNESKELELKNKLFQFLRGCIVWSGPSELADQNARSIAEGVYEIFHPSAGQSMEIDDGEGGVLVI